MSKTLGKLADARYRLREKRLALSRKVDELKAQEQELEGEIFSALKASEVTSATGSVATVSVTESEVPTLEDFDAFFAYAKRKPNQDLLPQRVSTTAWRARHAAGKTVPGVKAFKRVSLSITKKSSK